MKSKDLHKRAVRLTKAALITQILIALTYLFYFVKETGISKASFATSILALIPLFIWLTSPFILVVHIALSAKSVQQSKFIIIWGTLLNCLALFYIFVSLMSPFLGFLGIVFLIPFPILHFFIISIFSRMVDARKG